MSTFLLIAMFITGLSILASMLRIWKGPTNFDRLIGVAQVSANGVVILVLAGYYFHRPGLFLDIALTYALLAFFVPIALANYVCRVAESQHPEEVW